MFNAAETSACQRLIEIALEEDLGTAGDLTSQALISAEQPGRAALVARTAGVLAGQPAAAQAFAAIDARLVIQALREEGSRLTAGDAVVIVEGPVRSMLAGERIALNFLQRLSGIATVTQRYVDAISGLSCQILDTRKTTPGWRLLEKYAVRQGGGTNHRMGLYDGILIKDNHLAFQSGGPGNLKQSIAKTRAAIQPGMELEVEVETLEQLDAALECVPDIVLLDNMTLAQMSEAVRRRDRMAPAVRLEASGGVTLETVREIAETGVDRISVGALTHSVSALDIAMDYLS